MLHSRSKKASNTFHVEANIMSPGTASLQEQIQTETTAPSVISNWINNAHVASNSSKTIEVTSPATGETIGYCPISTAKDVDLAVAAAKKAFVSWSARTIKDRAQILIRYHQLLMKNLDSLADMIVLEHG